MLSRKFSVPLVLVSAGIVTRSKILKSGLRVVFPGRQNVNTVLRKYALLGELKKSISFCRRILIRCMRFRSKKKNKVLRKAYWTERSRLRRLHSTKVEKVVPGVNRLGESVEYKRKVQVYRAPDLTLSGVSLDRNSVLLGGAGSSGSSSSGSSRTCGVFYCQGVLYHGLEADDMKKKSLGQVCSNVLLPDVPVLPVSYVELGSDVPGCSDDACLGNCSVCQPSLLPPDDDMWENDCSFPVIDDDGNELYRFVEKSKTTARGGFPRSDRPLSRRAWLRRAQLARLNRVLVQFGDSPLKGREVDCCDDPDCVGSCSVCSKGFPSKSFLSASDYDAVSGIRVIGSTEFRAEGGLLFPC